MTRVLVLSDRQGLPARQDERELQLPGTCATNKTSRAETSSFVNKGNAALAGACCFPNAGKDRSSDDALVRP